MRGGWEWRVIEGKSDLRAPLYIRQDERWGAMQCGQRVGRSKGIGEMERDVQRYAHVAVKNATLKK